MVETGGLLRVAGQEPNSRSSKRLSQKMDELESDRTGHPISSFGLFECMHKLIHVHRHREKERSGVTDQER